MIKNEKRRARRYPNDLKKKKRQVIAPLLPLLHGNQKLELQTIADSIFYV